MQDQDAVLPKDIAFAVTRGQFRYEDGSTQTFDAAGDTTYIERGRPTKGQWYVDSEGRFCSYWPPSYRACYELRWIVEDRQVAGLSFRSGHDIANGRYEVPVPGDLFIEELSGWTDDAGAR
jgi:hypothetical protein